MRDVTATGGAGALLPPIDDPVYMAVVAARDPARLHHVIVKAWESAGLRVDRVRTKLMFAHYRPRVGARLMVRVKVPQPPPKKRAKVQYLYIQVYPTRGAALRRSRQVLKSPLKCRGPAVFLLEEWSALAWALPNGPLLRTTKMLLRPGMFGKFLVEAGIASPEGTRPKTPKLIRYVPRHRAVFRSRKRCGNLTGRCYVKVYSPRLDVAAAENLALAAEAAELVGFKVPKLIAHVKRRRALVMEEVPGRPLSELHARGDDAAFRAVGHALGGLHASGIVPDRNWSANDEVAALRRALRDVALAVPALAPTLKRLVGEIERQRVAATFPADRPIHGNMFGDQVLIGEGVSVGIVDWDDLCKGDPLFDVGRLAAHALFLAQRMPEGAGGAERPIASLLAGYVEGGGSIDSQRLRWHVATALLMRAKISALRPLPPSWLSDIELSTCLAAGILEGSATPGLPS